MPTLSTSELTKLSHTLARALSIDEVNQLGRDTGQAERLRTVTPHRLFLAVVATLGGGRVESLADLLRAFNYQNGETVAYKAFYNRLARLTEHCAVLVRLIAAVAIGYCGVMQVVEFVTLVRGSKLIALDLHQEPAADRQEQLKPAA